MGTHPKTETQKVYEALYLLKDHEASTNTLCKLTRIDAPIINKYLAQLQNRKGGPYVSYSEKTDKWKALVEIDKAIFQAPRTRGGSRAQSNVDELPEVIALRKATERVVAKYEELLASTRPLMKILEKK